MSERLKSKIRKRFNNIHFKKIILYNNPNLFNTMYIERVNPDHVGIIWGKRRRKLGKGTHYVKVGKVLFSMLPVVVGSSVIAWFDVFTGYIYNLLLNISIISVTVCSITTVLFYLIPMRCYKWKSRLG